ncbi:hypothetical protein ACLOJK_035139 [Asimina triloba]
MQALFEGIKLSAKTREGRETSMSSPLLLQLCLNISSERWKRERDELLPLLPLRTKKPRTSFVAEKKKKEKKEKAAKKGGGGGFLQVAPPPSPQRLFLDLNEEPNPLWEEMKAAGKPTVVFNRMLTDSDVRRDLARCILNRQEMLEVFLPALTEDEAGKVYDKERKLWVVVVEGRRQKKKYEMNVVWWPSLKQFALVNGWTEFVHDNRLLKDELIQLSYFRFSDDQQSQQQQQQQLGLLIHCRPEFLMADHQLQPNQDQEKVYEKEETL